MLIPLSINKEVFLYYSTYDVGLIGYIYHYMCCICNSTVFQNKFRSVNVKSYVMQYFSFIEIIWWQIFY
jgi:hypothetical protein